jgi:hypothetical protein
MRPQQEQHSLKQILKASLLYFAPVFGVGFVLGTIRTLWVAPRVGMRIAELMERQSSLSSSLLQRALDSPPSR